MTLLDPLRSARPDAPALLLPSGTWTFADLDRRVGSARAQLEAAGLERGDRLALWQVSVEERIVLLHACWRLGLVAVPIGPREAAVRERAAQVRAKALVAPASAASGLERTALLLLHPAGLLGGEQAVDTVEPWEMDRPASIVFTSGSTGAPKAALHTVANHVWSARGWHEALPLGPGDRWLLDLPLHHVGGMAVLWRCALAGAAVALPAPGESLPDTAHRLGLTHASLVPTQLRRALAHAAGSRESEALARMRLLLLGGAATPPDLIAEAAARGWPVAPSYGMTEMTSTVTSFLPGASPSALRTSGSPLPHREVRLSDEGEILVRGRTLFAGYLQPDGTLERPDARDGWFPTRDLGAWQDVGNRRMLQVTGRRDRQFISGGENVQPEEIERALLALPGVEESAVVAVEDAEYGHRPVAFVRGTADLAALADALPLPSFKRPDAVYPWPADAPPGMKPDRLWLTARARSLRSP